MTARLTATELRASITAALDRVATGEEVEITKHGRVVAHLVPARGPHALRGAAAGVARTIAADDDLLATGAGGDRVVTPRSHSCTGTWDSSISRRRQCSRSGSGNPSARR